MQHVQTCMLLQPDHLLLGYRSSQDNEKDVLWSSFFQSKHFQLGHKPVTHMQYLFYYARSFNQPIGTWDTSHVIYMHYMFFQAKAFNQNLETWDTSFVTHMHSMFCKAKSFNHTLNRWNFSNVVNTTGMLYKAAAYSHVIPIDLDPLVVFDSKWEQV